MIKFTCSLRLKEMYFPTLQGYRVRTPEGAGIWITQEQANSIFRGGQQSQGHSTVTVRALGDELDQSRRSVV